MQDGVCLDTDRVFWKKGEGWVCVTGGMISQLISFLVVSSVHSTPTPTPRAEFPVHDGGRRKEGSCSRVRVEKMPRSEGTLINVGHET